MSVYSSSRSLSRYSRVFRPNTPVSGSVEGVECAVKHVYRGQTNSGCIIEGGLLIQVQTHAMETLGSINLVEIIIDMRVAC